MLIFFLARRFSFMWKASFVVQSFMLWDNPCDLTNTFGLSLPKEDPGAYMKELWVSQVLECDQTFLSSRQTLLTWVKSSWRCGIFGGIICVHSYSYLVLYFSDDGILYRAGHVHCSLESLPHSNSSTEQHKQAHFKLATAVGCAIKGCGWWQ